MDKLLIIVICGTLLTELLLRIKFFELLKIRAYPLIYEPHDELGYRYIPNKEALINIPSIKKTVKINKHGFHGPDFDAEKKENIFRILIIGASAECGIWLNGEEHLSIAMQKLINSSYRNVEVLNCSYDGQSREMYNLRLMQSYVLDYSPDLILYKAEIPITFGPITRSVYKGYVLMYDKNNPESLLYCKSMVDKISKKKGLIFLYTVSFIVRAICRIIMYKTKFKMVKSVKVFVEKKIEAPGTKYKQYPLYSSFELLKQTRDILEQNSCKLILYQYGDDVRLKGALEKEGLDCFFLGLTDDDETFRHKHDIHPNEKGIKFMAEELIENLKAKNCIPEYHEAIKN